jgi:cytochrome c oxidase cbb3-type subunit 2
MWDPKSVVPQSIMPAYKHQFTNIADIDTAYAEALTVKKVFATPYDAPNGTKLGTLDEGRAAALAEAKVIAADMKNKDVEALVAKGEIPEVVAIIAYMNRLK